MLWGPQYLNRGCILSKKRSNSEGTIFYRESRRRWEAQLVVGWKDSARLDAAGDPIRVPVRKIFTGPTRKAVAAKLAEAQHARAVGAPLPDHRQTVAEYLEWWLEHAMTNEGLAPATETWYRNVFANYVLPGVGDRTLTGPKALTPSGVERMYGDLSKAGKSHRVQCAARDCLSKALHTAQVDGRILRNAARLARAPKRRGEARKVKAFTSDELATLLDRLEASRWHPVALVGATTGLRPGELLGLHWQDVDLDGSEPTLAVRFSISDGTTLKAPKRDRSYRRVPLVPEAITAFVDWRGRQDEEQSAAGPLWSTDWPGIVFTAADGRPQRGDVFRVALGRAMPGAHPHRLRHTYATHLLEAGTPIHHVAELLGDSVATVENAYSHVLRPKTEVVGLVSGLLQGHPRPS